MSKPTRNLLSNKSQSTKGSGGQSAQIEHLAVSSLVPYARNSRTHSDSQVAQIAASIKEFGFCNPVLVDKNGGIIAGHGRVMAATQLGLETIPCLRLSHLTETQRRAYVIADNQIALNSEWDQEVLALELADLGELEFDVDMLGFDADFLAGLSEEPDAEPVEDVAPQIDRAEELKAAWGTEAGQLWSLGSHRLLCGNAKEVADVVLLMGEAKAVCVMTDPPYGVSIAKKNSMLNTFQKAGRCLASIEDDDMEPDELSESLLPAFENLRTLVMRDDCTLLVCSPQGGELSMMMMMMMTKARLKPRHVLIWRKNQPTFSMGRLDYDYQHEPILMTWGKRHSRPMNGTHKTSVWDIDKPRSSLAHPTMKPVELYENAYQNHSEVGDVLADIYAGSGTAFIAAENTGRICYGMEISPAYCAVILQRFQDATGVTPTLVSDV